MTTPESSPAATPCSSPTANSFAAGVAGRDPASHAKSRGDERAWARLVPIGVFLGLLVHGLGFAGATWALGHDPLAIWWLLAIPCFALAALDYSTTSVREYSRAADLAREMRPDMPTAFAGSRLSDALRWSPPVLTGMLLGLMLSLAILKEDTSTEIARMNGEERDRIEGRYVDVVAAERAILQARVKEARAELAAAKALDPRQVLQAERATALQNLQALRADEATLQADKTAFEITAVQARERMACELGGTVSARCPGATGQQGEGTEYEAARKAAEDADASVLDLEVALAAKAREIEAFAAKIPPVPSTEMPLALKAALEALLRAEDDFLGFDSATEVQARADADPTHRVFNPDALSDQFRALKRVIENDPAMLWVVVLTKVVMVALECLVLIMGTGVRPGEYHIARGVSLALAVDGARRVMEDSYLKTHAQHAHFNREVMEDDPKIVRLRRDLARDSAREAAEGLRASEAQYIDHLVRGSRPSGIAAE